LRGDVVFGGGGEEWGGGGEWGLLVPFLRKPVYQVKLKVKNLLAQRKLLFSRFSIGAFC